MEVFNMVFFIFVGLLLIVVCGLYIYLMVEVIWCKREIFKLEWKFKEK